MKILIVDAGPGTAEALAHSLRAVGWAEAGAATNSDEAVEWMGHAATCGGAKR